MRQLITMPLRQFFISYYAPAKNIQGRSHRAFLDHFAMFDRFHMETIAPRPVELRDLSDDLVIACMAWDIARGRSPATANGRRHHINAVWNFAARRPELRGLLSRPDSQDYQVARKLPIALMPDQLSRILWACTTLTSRVGDVPACLWWEFFVRLAYNTGARLRALRLTPTSNLDLDRGEILIPAAVQKHRRDQRVRLFQRTVEVARRLRLIERRRVFILDDFAGNDNTLRRHWAKLLVHAGLFPSPCDVPKWYKPHIIRKTLASHIGGKYGVEKASQFLQHSSSRVTERYYLDPRFVERPDVPELLEDPLPMTPLASPPLRVVGTAAV